MEFLGSPSEEKLAELSDLNPLPGDVIPLRVGFDAELDRVVGFACLCLVVSHHGCQVGGFHPRLTTHVI